MVYTFLTENRFFSSSASIASVCVMFSVFLCLHFSQFMYAGYWGVYVVLVVSSAIDDMTLHCTLRTTLQCISPCLNFVTTLFVSIEYECQNEALGVPDVDR